MEKRRGVSGQEENLQVSALGRLSHQAGTVAPTMTKLRSDRGSPL